MTRALDGEHQGNHAHYAPSNCTLCKALATGRGIGKQGNQVRDVDGNVYDMRVVSKFMQYIRNTGGRPKTEDFDEDWEPIGPVVRRDLLRKALAYEENGRIFLSDKGSAKLRSKS